MIDSISRQMAKDRIKAICEKYGLSYEEGERKPATGGSAYALGHAFNDLPSAIPEGEWIKVKENRMSIDMSGELVTQYKCSKCGRMIATLPSKLADYPFCHCGAEMRG